MERLRARFISRSLHQHLAEAGFAGQVLSVHDEVCNLASEAGDVVALVTPPVGNGPFNLMLVARAGVFHGLSPGMPARADEHTLRVERTLTVSLAGAEVWEPRLGEIRASIGLDGLEESLARLWDLVRRAAPAGSLVEVVDPRSRRSPRTPAGRHARPAIGALARALRAGDGDGVSAAAATLAGLGPGLTPSGDDLLVGLMASLYTWSKPLSGSGWTAEQACAWVARSAVPRTTTLSAAWLRAAAAGEFAEPWHQLVTALGREEGNELEDAARRLLAQGATSGADALAGFLAPYLATRNKLNFG